MSVPSPFDNPRLLVGRERELNVLRGHLRGAQKKDSFQCLDKGVHHRQMGMARRPGSMSAGPQSLIVARRHHAGEMTDCADVIVPIFMTTDDVMCILVHRTHPVKRGQATARC